MSNLSSTERKALKKLEDGPTEVRHPVAVVLVRRGLASATDLAKHGPRVVCHITPAGKRALRDA